MTTKLGFWSTIKICFLAATLYGLFLDSTRAQSSSNLFSVYSDSGIPAPPAVLYTWNDSGCTPSFNALFADSTAPEGQSSFIASGSSCPWFGWGIFEQSDMRAFADGQLRFYLKSTKTLRVELEGPKNQKSGFDVPSTGGQWVEQVFSISGFTNVNLGQLYGLFLITSTDGHTVFYVDNVRWIKPGPALALLTLRTNGICPALPDQQRTLQDGISYSLTASPKIGYAFANWSDGSGQILTNTTKINFVMRSNLVLVANYTDVSAPSLKITAPIAGQRSSNANFVIKGSASDNGCINNILYQLNNGTWTPATSTNGWSNWTASVTLTPGTNSIRAYAIDVAGNRSATGSVSMDYVVTASLSVQVNGHGSVSPAHNGQQLEVGTIYSMTATPGVGYAFANWTGSQTTNTATLKFLMAPNLTFQANFVDAKPPTLVITAPTAGQRWSNALFTVKGTASDNGPMGNVWYQLNGGNWMSASTANGWSNWTASVTLAPGTNSIRAYAMDAAGNRSPTGSVSMDYVLTAPLSVQVNGHGSVSPNYNGQKLQVGTMYSMTAMPGTGYAFTNWTGSQTTNAATLKFSMAANLTFQANFVDIKTPTLVITTPTAGQRWSNALFTVKGTASDNGPLGNVWYQLNGGNWMSASTANGWSNWTASVTLAPGTNSIRAYAIDAAGNRSPTGSVSMDYVLTASLSVQVNGHGSVSPNYDGQKLQVGTTYSMTAMPGVGYAFTNWTGSHTTNTATLKFLMASNLTFQANFVDVKAPALAITMPVPNQRWSNAVLTVRGTATDNGPLNNVWYRLNGGAWLAAVSTNGWSNWTASVTLTPGTNSIQAYAIDAAGNRSPTGSVSIYYVLTAPIVVEVNGKGTVNPNYDQQSLAIGTSYRMTALPVARHKFTGWTGNLITTNATIDFLAASNSIFRANFEPAAPMMSGIDFSPYEPGQDPNFGTPISLDQLRERMNILAPYTEWIRTYGCTSGLENAGRIAHELQFKAAIGAWLSWDTNANAQEIANLIQVAKQGYADAAIVGSETLLRGDLTEEQLIGYVAQVKQALPNLPVATADSYGQWLAHPKLVQAVDFLMVNYYPYWQGVNITNAIPTIHGWHKQLTRAAGTKQVIVSETGWPSDGDTIGKAVPSQANASHYLLDFNSWALSNNVSYFYFEAFDEAWKTASEGPQGAHWGIWDENGKLKSGMQAIFNGQTLPDTWSGREIPGGPGTPTVVLTHVPAYGSSELLTGQVLHASWTDYAVVVYIYVSNWWIKPTYAAPLTSIAVDGSWSCNVTTGGYDQYATAYQIYVVPFDYSPPLLGNSPTLPSDLDRVAIAKIFVPRTQ